MSPEQCRGAANIDAQTDVYALGCILFELIARRPPFVGDTIGRLMSAHLTETPPLLTSLGCKIPRALDGLVAQALAKLPHERPAIPQVLEVLKAHERWAIQQGAMPDGTLKPVSLVPPERAALTPTSVVPGEGVAPIARPKTNEAGGNAGAAQMRDHGSPHAVGPPTMTIGGDRAQVAVPKKRRRTPVIAGAAVGLIAVGAAALALRPSEKGRPGLDREPASSTRPNDLPVPHTASTPPAPTPPAQAAAAEVLTPDPVVDPQPPASAAPSSSAPSTLPSSAKPNPGPAPDRAPRITRPPPSQHPPGSERLPIE
jgi:serine/threonine-protein kinase